MSLHQCVYPSLDFDVIVPGKKMLIVEPEECLGGWGLIDCDPVTGDPTQQDMDIILLLTQRAYYIAK